MENTEQAKIFFANDRYATHVLGVEIVSAEPHRAVCRMAARPDLCNAMGAVMGGALFSLCDFAFAVAANSPTERVVTLSANTHFLAPARGSSFLAEDVCVRDGGHVCVYEVTVTDEAGEKICLVTLNGYKKYL